MKKKIVYKPVQLTKQNEKNISKIVKIPVGTIKKKNKNKPTFKRKKRYDETKIS
jgi:hypothetical protein